MVRGVEQVASLPDPVGEISDMAFRPSGIHRSARCAPLGVIGIIYEARLNVTADAAALCLKSGNAAILRGGSKPSAATAPLLPACAKLAGTGLPDTVYRSSTPPTAPPSAFDHHARVCRCDRPRRGGAGTDRAPARRVAGADDPTPRRQLPRLSRRRRRCRALAIVENAKTQAYGTCKTPPNRCSSPVRARR